VRTLGEDLRARAQAAPGAEAIVAGDVRASYAELDAAADGFAATLRDAGVARGDRVLIVLPNRYEAAVAVYGVLRAGAAISPLNPTIKAEKLGFVAADSGAAAIVADDSTRAVAEAGGVPVLSVSGEAGASEPPPLDVDLAAVIYTSGSTGEPKGVTLTHRNMTFAADAIVEYLGIRAGDRVLCTSPLSFDYGLYQLLMCIRVGATLVLEHGFPFAGRIVQLLDGERITALPGVPTLFHVLIGLRGLAERPLPALRFLTNTGQALPVATIDALRRTFPGVAIYSMYGLTECKRVSYLPPDQLAARPTSVGRAIPGTEAWVDDGRGGVAAPGVVGELLVRGGHVMQGYWNAPEATAERLRPGRWPWERVLATGDLFRADEDGYLYFVGRRDDLIKSRGEKVVPREVEDVLHGADGVAEAAVVGVPDERLGQAVVAHVSGIVADAAALRAFCAAHLESHMVPARIVLHDGALPRTPNGKVDRRALAEWPA
jgi:amino acid adenylation domain-containing protein